MRRKTLTFVTLFPECGNNELVKDVGQIPYMLSQIYGYKASIVHSKINPAGPNLKSINGVSLIHMPMLFNNISLTGIVYLLFNAKKIDWLNLYHAGRRSLYWTKLYKFLNPNGKVYLKLDLDFRSCKKYDNDLWEREFLVKNVMSVDLVTVETKAVLERILPYTGNKVKLLGNGYCEPKTKLDVESKRENIFLTVGRLGTEQKATDILLDAFAQTASQHNWILKLIGSMAPDFESTKEKFFHDHPELRNRIIFTGNIDSRERLYNEYCKAKVFVLPSRWESFGLVCAEALSCGCHIIVSDQVPPMQEVTNDGKYGQIVPADNISALAQAMLQATQCTYTSEKASEIAEYAREHLAWDKICRKLYEYMTDQEAK